MRSLKTIVVFGEFQTHYTLNFVKRQVYCIKGLILLLRFSCEWIELEHSESIIGSAILSQGEHQW